MSLKSWVLGRVQQMGSLTARSDLPAREAPADNTRGAAQRTANSGPPAQSHEASLASAEHLGAYAGLIAAIRDELEHFVASHVRLHLAIAERDRFLLSAIGVRCREGASARQLLNTFMREFKPEQVKRYLAREVIGALPNASAIDLSQFAGLFDADARDEAEVAGESGADNDYRELLESLRSTPVAVAVPRPYQVSIVGRWAEVDPKAPASPTLRKVPAATPSTPLAGQRCEFDIEDGDGKRRIVLQAVVPGRRYVVGTGEGCDIRVRGTYASRRHAELWLDQGAWWVGDAGSTNGLRVEPLPGGRGAGRSTTAVPGAGQAIELAQGAHIVLSARAEGPAADYPWLAMRPSVPATHAARPTPIAAGFGAGPVAAAPRTPLTAISPPWAGDKPLEIRATMAGGVRTLELRASSLPLSVGRSRNQALVVDRGHEAVSGHHLDITAIDETGAQVLVHGDNGVFVNGVHHGPGAQLRWPLGETLVLGASKDERPSCTLTLGKRKAS